MASYGDDATLMKVAIFGIAMSLICTLGIQIMFVEASSDYDYEDIQAYRDDLIQFSGESMINNSPWVLTGVFTPWDPAGEVKYRNGWLYGEEIDDYPGLNTSADIKMDPEKKSTVPITFTREQASYTEQDGTKWWGSIPIIKDLGTLLGFDPYNYKDVPVNNWNFTGYRYEMTPTLPFAANEDTASARDGSLSLIWYSYNGQEGISGGLDIYAGRTPASSDVIKLASYSATDIIADYNASSAFATVYDFDFEGTHLNLSIKFEPDAIESGMPLMQAWTEGRWSYAISSVSAGNFLDIQNSAAFSDTMGGMLNTFVKIYSFDMPQFNNPWASMILWLMVGLPMTIAMLCVTLRLVKIVPGLG